MTVFKGVLALLLLPGCAFLPLESARVPHYSSRAVPSFPLEFREIVGAIHVHSTYSDGRLPPEAIARIAARQGLAFVLLTDHDTLRGRAEGKQGAREGVLLLCDEEISTRGGHYLGLRLPEEVQPYQAGARTIEAVHAAGGLGFIAHPFTRRSGWKDPAMRGMTGLEIYNAREDMEDENLLTLGAGILLFGADLSIPAWLDRPSKTLAWWDRLLADGQRVVAIGGANAHGLERFGLRLGPYATLFKLVRNHLLIRGELSEQAVYDALERGHLFVAHDIVADARGFLFAALRDGAVQGVMGDEVRGAAGLELYVYLPSPGEMVLYKDGRAAARARGQQLRATPDGPGVYRLEATRKGRPWIYSKPIYVLE